MSPEEMNELIALKKAINQNPASVHPDKMEKFTELMVKSLSGMNGDYNRTSPTNY